MKIIEKNKKVQAIKERMLELLSIMSSSDAYASKCVKLGVAFKDVYPSEFAAYIDARDEYNALEMELSKVMQTEIDEEILPYEI